MRFSTLAVVMILGVAVALESCSWVASSEDPNNPLTATFNLLPLSGYDYTIRDSQWTVASRNFTYVFSFCDVVKNVPYTKAGNGTQCYRTGEEEPVHYPAYQVAQTNNLCLALGKDAKPENVRWSLIDPTDPTVGVNYQYINGDDAYCGAENYRSLTIELTCKDQYYNIPDEEPVYENNCAYKFSIDSVYGCPTECGLYRSSLCGQRGLCKFDLDTHKPHCYCQKGWTGYSCNEQGDNKAEGFTNTTLILAVILILLIFVELGVIMMWDKVKRLRLDPAAYSAFTATADDLAYYCLLYHSSFSNILYC